MPCELSERHKNEQNAMAVKRLSLFFNVYEGVDTKSGIFSFSPK